VWAATGGALPLVLMQMTRTTDVSGHAALCVYAPRNWYPSTHDGNAHLLGLLAL
jgi:hypothetical protein